VSKVEESVDVVVSNCVLNLVRDSDKQQLLGESFRVLRRGVPMAVCEKTFRIYTREPYADDIIPVPPHAPVEDENLKPFDCSREAVRDPRETKGQEYDLSTAARGVRDGGICC